MDGRSRLPSGNSRFEDDVGTPLSGTQVECTLQHDRIRLFGLCVPKAALRAKCGSVILTVLMYTLYPFLVMAGMFALVEGSVLCERGSFDVCARALGIMPQAHAQPLDNMPDGFLVFVVATIGLMVFNTLWLAITLLSPVGMSEVVFFVVMASHKSRFGTFAASVAILRAVFAALYIVSLFELKPLDALLPNFTSSAVFVCAAILLILPLHVIMEYPFSTDAKESRWKVHARRCCNLFITQSYVCELFTAICSFNRTLEVNSLLAALQMFCLTLRVLFGFWTAWTGYAEITIASVFNYLAILFPAWTVAGMAFGCLGPFNDAGSPADACAVEAWMVHGANILFGACVVAGQVLVAMDLTPITLSDADRDKHQRTSSGISVMPRG